MAHAFDNRNFIPGKQQTFYSVVSPSSRPDITNVLWESSSSPSPSPRIQNVSPQASPKPNHPPPSYEESIFNKALANRQNSRSSLHSPSIHYYANHQQQNSPNPKISPFISYSLPSTPNDTNHYQRQQQQQQSIPGNNISIKQLTISIYVSYSGEYYSFVSPHRSSDTKPPPPARMPKVPSTINNNSINQTNTVNQYSPSGMKTSTTYLNTTQLFITHSPSRDQPPPPPPRYPLQPPAIPPRGSPICHQSNPGMISEFSSAASPRPTSQTIYRSPVISSTVKRSHVNDSRPLECQFNSLSLNNNREQETTMKEYSLGRCRKCNEMITNSDDACDIFGQIYHNSCAVCVLCGRAVKNKYFFVKDQLYCEEDFLVKLFLSR